MRTANQRVIQRRHRLKKQFGLTEAAYQQMHDQQGGVCMVCHRPETSKESRTGATRHLAVDHDHRTGRVRGLVCRRCNVMLGAVQENVWILKSAVAYLRPEVS